MHISGQEHWKKKKERNHQLHCQKKKMIGTTFFQIYMPHSYNAKDVCVMLSHPLAAAQLLWWDVVTIGQRAPPGGLCNFHVVGLLGEEVRAVLRTHTRRRLVSFWPTLMDWFPSAPNAFRVSSGINVQLRPKPLGLVGVRAARCRSSAWSGSGRPPNFPLQQRRLQWNCDPAGTLYNRPAINRFSLHRRRHLSLDLYTPSNLWLAAAAAIHSTCTVKSSSSIRGAVAMETAGAQCRRTGKREKLESAEVPRPPTPTLPPPTCRHLPLLPFASANPPSCSSKLSLCPPQRKIKRRKFTPLPNVSIILELFRVGKCF